MELIESFFGVIGDLTWGWSLIPFLVILGLFFTVATGFGELLPAKAEELPNLLPQQ